MQQETRPVEGSASLNVTQVAVHKERWREEKKIIDLRKVFDGISKVLYITIIFGFCSGKIVHFLIIYFQRENYQQYVHGSTLPKLV